jgi:hypothetical protein
MRIKRPPVLLVFEKASKNQKFSGKNHERTSGSFCGWVIYLIFGGKRTALVLCLIFGKTFETCGYRF